MSSLYFGNFVPLCIKNTFAKLFNEENQSLINGSNRKCIFTCPVNLTFNSINL